MSITNQLREAVAGAFKALFEAEVALEQIQVQKTRKEFEGDLTVNVFPFLKLTRKGPEQSGEAIGAYLMEQGDLVIAFQVVKGFLNLTVNPNVWLKSFELAAADENFGFGAPSGRTVMVEYSSPNTNKPLHLGHLRNNFLGYSVSEILKANGHKVLKTQIINDRGIHICKSMVAWLHFGNGETPETAGMKGDHLVGKYYVEFDKAYKKEIAELKSEGLLEDEAKEQAPIMIEAREMLLKWEAKDPEVYQLWQNMNGWVYEGFDATYKRLGVDFDHLYYESDTYLYGKSVVEEGLEKGVFYRRDDGSVWIDLTEEGLDEKLILRADGTAVYMTQDIGTAIQRFNDYKDLNQLIYTVGDEQNYHFKVLFIILDKLGYEWAKECYHLSYGMVELPHGRMKSREGTVVDADDLMEEMHKTALAEINNRGANDDMSDEEKVNLAEMLGLGALKYFILRVDPKKKMMFNPEESIDLNGNTGPFIQYTHARIQSIVRRGADYDYTGYNGSLEEKELDLMKHILDFEEAISEAGKIYSPAIVGAYCYELTKVYNSFYQAVPILKSDDNSQIAFRIHLSQITGSILKRGMRLLGIDLPERM